MYIGKHHDGFAYAVNTIFKESGCQSFPDPDFYSYRLTTFLYHPCNLQWFQPMLNWNDYMNHLIENTGIIGNYILKPVSIELLQELPIETLFLLGEASVPNWDITPINKICNQHQVFLVCKKKAGFFLINNPLGCISMQCSLDQLILLSVPNRSFIFSLEKTVHFTHISSKYLLNKICPFIKQNSLAVQIDKEPILPDRAKNKIAFQYGLIRYVQSRIRFSDFFLLNKAVKYAFGQIRIGNEYMILPNIINAENIFINEIEHICKKKEG